MNIAVGIDGVALMGLHVIVTGSGFGLASVPTLIVRVLAVAADPQLPPVPPVKVTGLTVTRALPEVQAIVVVVMGSY